jgi:hypothetical protein
MVWALENAPVRDHRQLLVLIALANYADQDGCNAYPSVPTLARNCRMGERTVQRVLKELVAEGLISEVRPARRHTARAYSIAGLRGANLTPLEGGRGVKPGHLGVPKPAFRGDTRDTRTVEPSENHHARTRAGGGGDDDAEFERNRQRVETGEVSREELAALPVSA